MRLELLAEQLQGFDTGSTLRPEVQRTPPDFCLDLEASRSLVGVTLDESRFLEEITCRVGLSEKSQEYSTLSTYVPCSL